MKVAILFDGASALGKTPDMLILEAVEAVERVLAADAHEAVRVPINPDARWIERIRRGKFDLAFNLCESVDGVAALEPSVVSVLELLGVPYTGSSSATTTLCLRKHLVNTLLDRAGLPVPRWGIVRPGGSLPTVGYPAICKPAAEDASLGIEQRSVVRTGRALAERVDAMHERWDEVVVQRYIDGREVNVGIVGDRVLPIAEVDFRAMPRGLWRIVSYRSKWVSGSDEDLGAAPHCPADLPSELTAEIVAVALAAWRVVGGTGYGRVDMRIDRAGRPWILEVNANPDVSPTAGLARMALVAGMDYAALVRLIAEHALAVPTGLKPDQWTLSQQLSGVSVANLDLSDRDSDAPAVANG
jgi:D-alanine-D-alanine ligase